MTFSFDPAISRDIDEVRLRLGDTDNTDTQLEDETIEFLLSSETNPLQAAAHGAEMLAAKYTRQVDYSLGGDRSEKLSNIAKQYIELARRLRREAGTGAVLIYAGGISVADRESYRQDTDRIQPDFIESMDDEPGTLDQSPIRSDQYFR